MERIQIMMTNKEYLNYGGSKCPKCKSENISTGAFNTDSNEAWCSVTCEDCKLEFTELYKLIGFKLEEE
jgi:transposase-like protein